MTPTRLRWTLAALARLAVFVAEVGALVALGGVRGIHRAMAGR